MKTSAAQKYITVDTIRRALVLMRLPERPVTYLSPAVRAAMPTREQIIAAGNEALRTMRNWSRP